VSGSQRFYDLLFEISNEYRHGILLLLQAKAMRITDLTKELSLTTPEVRRHISRLREASLAKRDLEGFYSLTPYGETTLLLLKEFDFMSLHSDYFVSHSLTHLPQEFVKRIGELEKCEHTDNVMDFLHFIEKGIKEAKEYIWLQVDQYPLTALTSIYEAINRGVHFRILEDKGGSDGPLLDLGSPEEPQLSRTRHTPLVEQRTLERVIVYQYISEKDCALAFPTIEGGFDYKGFKAADDKSKVWCKELFQRYWKRSEPRVYTSPTEYVRQVRAANLDEPRGRVIVEGHNDSLVDAQVVQDAVDNYEEVILRGTFNFGSSMLQISRSVIVRGEGRENDIPSTILYKKGWAFPFREWDYLFLVNGEGADVTIENLSFTDFNCSCIGGRRGNSLNIRKNRITIPTGYGRGITYGAFGDMLLGIWIEAAHSFRGGVTIEWNYLDYAPGPIWGGHVSRGGLEDDPEYRPDLFNHEYYMGYGIAVNSVSGKVRIENNIVRNVNGRGIATEGHLASADVRIRHNTVISDVYGSYPFSSPEAGAGVLAQSVLSSSGPGFNVEIEDNIIKLDKLNFSGIVILGPATDRERAEKLRGGIIRNNRIQLKDGYEGIHVRKSDDFDVSDNTISGEAYYGIRISGRQRPGERDMRSLNNIVEDNDMADLRIREPDEYSNKHADGRMFAGSTGVSASAHIWLGKFSKKNVIKLEKHETVIDEGKNNTIKYVENES